MTKRVRQNCCVMRIFLKLLLILEVFNTVGKIVTSGNFSWRMKHVFAFSLFCFKGNILWLRYLNTAEKINGSLLSLNILSLNDSYSTLHLYFFKSFCRFGLKYPDKYLTNRGRQFLRFQSSGIWRHVNWYLGTNVSAELTLFRCRPSSFGGLCYFSLQVGSVLGFPEDEGSNLSWKHWYPFANYMVSCSGRLGFSSAPLRESHDYSYVWDSIQFLTWLMCMPLAVRWYFAHRNIL